ncbi:MAG TPA: HAMP domain-containing sensor histidine kinase [Polyangia bacterium]|nr:HAMP domain-containing sensor histidine kinase [Polyangia bacterium]
MKLTLKLGLALFPGALLVVAIAAYLELRQDRANFEADQRSDDLAIARLLADAVGQVWNSSGQTAALALLADRRALGAAFHVRWLPSDGHAAVPFSHDGGVVSWRDAREDGGWLHTLIPIPGGVQRGSVDLAEAPAALRPSLAKTIKTTTLTTLGLGAMMVTLTLIVGAWMVGRPISALIDQTRRVGGGDLRARSLSRQRDELGDLAQAFDGMLDRLQAAAREVELSTRQRIAALDQLRHADRLTTVGRLASSVAHELGTPLAVVAGRARLVVEDEREAVQHAQVIIDQTGRMTKIIRQLLDYARRGPPQKQPSDLVPLARDVLPVLETLARKRQVALRFWSEVASAPIVADPAQVQQALTNLVLNAIQASAVAGAVDVTVRPARAARAVAGAGAAPAPEDVFDVCVQDHGPGIPPDVLARVFEPFFTTKPIGESTGLGLSVANDIVDEHGGWISAESEPAHGSRFTMHLPQERA